MPKSILWKGNWLKSMPRSAVCRTGGSFSVRLVFSGLLWYAYSAGVRSGSETAAPLLSLNGPIKVPPPSPGGRTFAHQEKTVFNRVDGSDREPKAERILPGPEKPLEPKVASAPPSVTGAPVNDADKKPLISVTKKPQTALVKPPTRPANGTDPTKLTPIPVTPRPETKQAPAAGGSLTNSYRIQTGALSTRAKAEQAWAIVAAKNKDLLGNLRLHVERVVVRGTVYYRVQAGPLPDRATTADVCNLLKERGQGCIIVTPK
jgi:hypothetical protein